jgi:hypothetical protein
LISKLWKKICDLLKFKKTFNSWTISGFDYDPSIWFIIEFNLELKGYGSFQIVEKENYNLINYERTVVSLVLFRTKIIQVIKKWSITKQAIKKS